MYLGVIVKLSKLCNLRCVYCYETPELSNKQRMSLEQIEKMFLHLSRFWQQWANPAASNKLRFIWHGGEPFAQPIDYWESILLLQRKIFGDGFAKKWIANGVQSNGTLLTEKHLKLLRNFELGISYDVLNEHRVDTAGRSTDRLLRQKLDWLQSRQIKAGGIAVISESNVDQPRTVAEFFLNRRMSFRALPIYKALDLLPQIRDLAVPFESYLQFCRELWHMPLLRKSMQSGLTVEPLTTARSTLDWWETGRTSRCSDQHCKEMEWVIAVNTDGQVYSPGDCYFPEYAYGNIFSKEMEEILFESEGRKRRITKSSERMNELCHPCFLYRRGCNGTHVSHATPEEFREFSRNGGCYQKLLAETMLRSEKTASVVSNADPAACSKTAEDRAVYSHETLYLNLTYRCNSRCLFCAADVAYKEEPRTLSLEQLSRLLEGKRYFRIALSGGEPTIHPDFFEIVQRSSAHSQNVLLLTHGRSLSKLDFARKVLDSGVTHFVIPLYGHDHVAHDFVSHIPGSFDQTLHGFENLEALREEYLFSVELKLLLTKYTAPLNRLIYRRAKQEFPNAFDAVSICPLIYSKSTIDYWDRFSAPFQEVKEDFLKLVREIRADARYALHVQQFPPCFFRNKKNRALAHPDLEKPVLKNQHFYADDLSTGRIAMNNNASHFYSTANGNVLVQSCKRCAYQDYCSEKQTPYFAAAYLERFGEKEFHPLSAPRTGRGIFID
jgi:uncharacterized protein